MTDDHAPNLSRQNERHQPMTPEQGEYLHTLCDEAGEPFTEKLSRGQANEKIDELQMKTGRLPD